MTDVTAAESLRLRAAAALAATLIPLGSTMLAVAVPSIARDLALDATRITPWIVTSYLVVSIFGQWPGGRAGDAIGPLRALRIGQLLCAMGAIAGMVANSLATLVAGRVLMAAGGAIMIPAATAALRDATPEGRRLRVFGWFGSLMAFAAAVGPLAGGEITARFGWRATFALQLVPLVASIALCHGMGGSARRPAARSGTGELALLRTLVRNRAFMGGGFAIALQNTAMYSVLFAMPLLLADVRGESAASIGRALLGMTGAVVAGSSLGGHAAERFGARRVAIVAAALSVAGLMLLHDVAALKVASDAVPGLVLLGLGVGLMNGPAQGTAMSAVPPDRGATAAGVLSMLRYAGGVLGMMLLAPLDAGATPAIAEAQHASVIVLLGVAAGLSGVAGALLPGRVR